tara:strand:+ start:740 stop:1495 length:756 start_codon:yes stop_codon:yes gene_type:complete
MKTALLITVRNGSTRLPNKALKDFMGYTTISFLINRIKLTNNFDKIILCTTNKDSDDSLVLLAKENSIEFFRGSEEDKILRWFKTMHAFDLDYIVNIDGDDLLACPNLSDMAIQQIQRNHSDIIKSDNIICGAFTYAFSYKALKMMCENKNTNQTEMVAPFFESLKLKVEELEDIDQKYYRNDIRMTLDYPEDLIFFKKIVSMSKEKELHKIKLSEVIDIINFNPDILKVNYFRHLEWKNNQNRIIQNQRK